MCLGRRVVFKVKTSCSSFIMLIFLMINILEMCLLSIHLLMPCTCFMNVQVDGSRSRGWTCEHVVVLSCRYRFLSQERASSYVYSQLCFPLSVPVNCRVCLWILYDGNYVCKLRLSEDLVKWTLMLICLVICKLESIHLCIIILQSHVFELSPFIMKSCLT